MPEIVVTIAGRAFELTCGEGEEKALKNAANRLDTEAAVLTDAMGRIPESRLLLLAGLMVANKTVELENDAARIAEKAAREANDLAQKTMDDLRKVKGELTRAKVRLADLQERFDAELKSAEQKGQASGELLESMNRMVEAVERVAAPLTR